MKTFFDNFIFKNKFARLNKMSAFYDELSPFYHVIGEGWNQSADRQSLQLTNSIHPYQPDYLNLLGVSRGTGTHAISFSTNGHRVTSSDLSKNVTRQTK